MTHRERQFEQAARAWAMSTGASVWLCDRGGAVEVRVDNPPAGFGFTRGSPEEFFRRIGGQFRTPQRLTSPLPLKFSLRDYRAATKAYGANCGYGAMAAILGLPLDEVRRLAPGAEDVGGIKGGAMSAAIQAAGWECKEIGTRLPVYGVAIVRSTTGESHWIAVCGDKIFDNHSMGVGLNWCDATVWWKTVAPTIAASPGGDREWRVDWGLEVER